MAKADLTAARLRELLHYDQETGEFVRRRQSARMPAGSKADCIDQTTGYIRFGVGGKNYYAHRLAWFYVYGAWPRPTLDHIDGNRTNNRISNLREAGYSVNAQNRRAPTGGKVYGCRLGTEPNTGKKKPWTARICADGRRIYIGCYATEEEAHQAYLDAKRRLHKGCTI